MTHASDRPGRVRRAMDLLWPREAGEREPAKRLDDLDDFLKVALERAEEAHRLDADNMREAYEDLEFRAGEHWPADARQRRERQKRPVLTVNDVPQFVRQITGDIRLMKPSIKALPIDARASEPVAKLMSGMIRYIENRSHARAAYATAADSQVACGVGHWRVTTEYAQETTFNQECRIVHVEDGVGVLWDADAILPTREDAQWCLVPVDLSRSKFQRKYPDVPLDGFMGFDRRYTSYWCGADTVRVAEYWEKRPARRRLALYPDGAVHDLTNAPAAAEARCRAEGAQIRERAGFRVFRSLITLGHVLEAPQEWPGRYIPIIRAGGEEVRIGRRLVRHGVVRFIKDPARLYNYARSQQAETYGLAPKAPWLGTAKNFEEFRDVWETANEENWPYLEYTPDPANANAPPQRISPPATSPGLSEAVALSARDKQSVTGIYNSSLGAHSNETSGIAIKSREQQSDVGNVVYVDNFSLAVAHTGAVLLDLIPHVYDTERMVQIQDEDGTVRTVTINRALVPANVPQEAEEPEEVGGDGFGADDAPADDEPADDGGARPGRGDADAIDLDPQGTRQDHVSPDIDSGEACDNDVTIGSYAVTFAAGPAYSTRREEAKDGMAGLIQAAPQIAPLILDLYARAQDWPLAEEIAERLQAMLPAPVKAMIAEGRARAAGAPMHPGMTPGAPPPGLMPPGLAPAAGAPGLPPNPVAIAGLQAELAKAQAAAEVARLDVETKAIERDIRALDLRRASVKSAKAVDADKDAGGDGLAADIARLHGMVAEIVAILRPARNADGGAHPN